MIGKSHKGKERGARRPRKRAAVRQRETELQQILDVTPQLVAVFGPERERLYANRPGLEFLGVTIEEWRGNPDDFWFFHPDDRERIARDIYSGPARDVPHEFEARLRRRDGTFRWFLFRDNPLRDAQGRITRWYLSATDIEDRRRAAEALQEAQAALAHVNRTATMGQLTASIAHEVNQPITAAITNAQVALHYLAAQPPNLEEVRQALGDIVDNGRRAAEVISRIRALVRRSPPRRERFDLNQAVGDVIVLARHEFLKHGVSVRTDLAAQLPAVDGDRVQLQQVLLNLVLNAIEAMSGQEGARELNIGTRRDGADAVVVTLRDTGPGIAPANLDRLFEPFYTTKADGMGMGLAICRSIIEGHGGRLTAGANRPRGAVFSFTLPAGQNGPAGP